MASPPSTIRPSGMAAQWSKLRRDIVDELKSLAENGTQQWGAKTRARMNAILARVNNGDKNLSVAETEEVYNLLPTETSADILPKSQFKEVVGAEKKRAREAKAAAEKEAKEAAKAEKKRAREARENAEKEAKEAAKAEKKRAREAKENAEKEAKRRKREAAKNTKTDATARSKALGRLLNNQMVRRYDSGPEAVEKAHANNTALLEAFDRERGEIEEEASPPEASPPEASGGGADPTHYPVGTPVPSVVLEEDDIEDLVETTLAPWVTANRDNGWWEKVKDDTERGDMRAFAAMFANEKSPRVMYDSEAGQYRLWTGNTWELSKDYADFHETLAQCSLSALYKYRAEWLEARVRVLKDIRDALEETVLGRFEAGVDKETDEALRVANAALKKEERSCADQLKYFAERRRDVNGNRKIRYIVSGKHAVAKITYKRDVEGEDNTSVWDKHPELIGTKTGVFDWGEGCSERGVIHRAGHPTDFCRARIGRHADWNPEYEEYVKTGVWAADPCGHPCPHHIRFLQDMFGQKELERRRAKGKWDAEAEEAMVKRIAQEVALIQVLLGASLAPFNTLQIAPVLQGEGGEGKTLLMLSVEHTFGSQLVGEIASSMVIKHPKAGGTSDNGHGAHTFTTKDRHLGIVNETGPMSLWNAKPFKGPATTPAEVCERRCHGSDYEHFTPKVVPWLTCQHIPKFEGNIDKAIVRRLVVLMLRQRFLEKPDKAKFNEHKLDLTLEARLKGEASAFLAFLLRGMWIQDQTKGRPETPKGLPQCPSVDAYKKAYLAAQDTVKNFIEDACVRTDDNDPSRADFAFTKFFEFYESWCEANGREKVRRIEFSARVLAVTGAQKKVSNGKALVFTKLKWNDTAQEMGWYEKANNPHAY